MSLFSGFKKRRKNVSDLELYEEKEINELEEYIGQTFGKFTSVFHEIVSPDIHLDVAIIDPTDEKPFYTLITMGAGAHKMNVPDNIAGEKREFIELMINLPSDWNIKSGEDRWYWPIGWLKTVARLPISENSWLGYGHTVGGNPGETLGDGTEFTALGMVYAETPKHECAVLNMSTGKKVHFFKLFPMYQEELDYKAECGDIDALLKKFSDEDLSMIIDNNRKNYCK